jgi:hypothetical protein
MKHRRDSRQLDLLRRWGGIFLWKLGKETGDMWVMKRGAKLQLTMVACADNFFLSAKKYLA